MKQRLFYVITLADMGGAQNHVLELVQGFRDIYDVEVVVGNSGYMTERLADLGVTCHVLPQMKRQISPLNDLKAIKALRRLLRDRAPVIVHAHSAKAGLVARIAARREGIRCVYSVHGWGFDKGVGTLRRMIVWPVEAIAQLFSDQLVTPSEYDKSLARRYLRASGKNITVIPYGIADKDGAAQAGADVAAPVIIMPARFSEQKDQETLIRAAALLSDVDFKIWLIGDGPNREGCEALAQGLGLSDKIEFLGMRRDLDDLLVQAHIFCLTTHYEGLPLTILEAMRFSMPVLASDVSGISEGVVHGETGFLARHKNANDVADSLRTLIADPNLRAAMGKAGRARFDTEYSNTIMRTRMGAFYASLIGTNAA